MTTARAQPRWWLRILVTLILVLAVMGALAGVAIANVVTLSREAAALRTSVLAQNELPARLQVQGSAGPVLLGMVRNGLKFIPDVPAEAHQALAAVRTLSCAVYRLDGDATSSQRAKLTQRALATMKGRGWERTICVQDTTDTVLVFTRPEENNRRVRVCVAVCSGGDLVIADATLDPERLSGLIYQQLAANRPI